jgi:hypothetical protein
LVLTQCNNSSQTENTVFYIKWWFILVIEHLIHDKKNLYIIIVLDSFLYETNTWKLFFFSSVSWHGIL